MLDSSATRGRHPNEQESDAPPRMAREVHGGTAPRGPIPTQPILERPNRRRQCSVNVFNNFTGPWQPQLHERIRETLRSDERGFAIVVSETCLEYFEDSLHVAIG